ncbi:hypothetical protein L0M92_12010, partial [Casaltella massiliensis]|nr:hypothetical protein [Casaltella massiliensis]
INQRMIKLLIGLYNHKFDLDKLENCNYTTIKESQCENLIKYIEENNYEILEDSIEITLVDSGLTTNSSEYVTEIQILVKRY